MGSYIVRRLMQSILVLFIVTIGVFTIMRTLPGDPVLVYVGDDAVRAISEEEIAALRHEYGLDKPVIIQYVDWVVDLLHGDLGISIIKQTSVASEIGRALPKTLYMGVWAWLFSIILGIPLGILAATKRGSKIDTAVTFFTNFGVTAPTFWIGILLILLFSVTLGWLPIQGYVAPADNFGESVRHLILPVVCLTLYPMCAVARQTRSAMLEVIRQDYIRTARAKGLKEWSVILKHAVRNGIIPVVTLVGMNVRQIFGGAVLIEKIFNIPGMGNLSVNALKSADYAVVQGCILIIAIAVVISNVVVDISYGWIDPRLRNE